MQQRNNLFFHFRIKKLRGTLTILPVLLVFYNNYNKLKFTL